MPVHEYAITNVHGLWEIRLDGRLTSGQPTQAAALQVVQALAHSGAARGEQSRILVFDGAGGSVEFPAIEPPAQPA